jgi:hypothetical protein
MAGDRRSSFFQALTGRAGADVSGTAGGDVRGMLIAAYGASHRDPAKPDTAAAAKSLGVSQRTVQRWLADPTRQQHYRPRADLLTKLSTRARQAATTKRGREKAIKDTLLAKGLPTGMRVSVTGQQGPERAYARFRTANFDLDDPSLSYGFVTAYIDGGDQGAIDWLRDNSDLTYNMDRWHFGDVEDVEIRGPYGRD